MLSSAGIYGGVAEAKMTGNTGVLPEMPRENTSYHSLPAQIIARQQLALLGLSRAQVSV